MEEELELKSQKVYRDAGYYPAGEDDFPKLRKRGCLYVDKTEYIYRMTRMGYVFLSRPRRFGKSLLCSTLEAYFQGRRELFGGLAIEKLEKEWEHYPVLRFNISLLKDLDVSQMYQALDTQLRKYEDIYGRVEVETAIGVRMSTLIGRAHARTGLRTVVIIDEYDSPMLAHLHDDENKGEVRAGLMKNVLPMITGTNPPSALSSNGSLSSVEVKS